MSKKNKNNTNSSGKENGFNKPKEETKVETTDMTKVKTTEEATEGTKVKTEETAEVETVTESETKEVVDPEVVSEEGAKEIEEEEVIVQTLLSAEDEVKAVAEKLAQADNSGNNFMEKLEVFGAGPYEEITFPENDKLTDAARKSLVKYVDLLNAVINPKETEENIRFLRNDYAYSLNDVKFSSLTAVTLIQGLAKIFRENENTGVIYQAINLQLTTDHADFDKLTRATVINNLAFFLADFSKADTIEEKDTIRSAVEFAITGLKQLGSTSKVTNKIKKLFN